MCHQMIAELNSNENQSKVMEVINMSENSTPHATHESGAKQAGSFCIAMKQPRPFGCLGARAPFGRFSL